jgi:T5orf172 domain
MAVKIVQDTEWNNRHGVVYFIHQPHDNLIKIGFTQANPLKRFEEHRRDTPDPIEWLGCFEATAREEIELHGLFDTQRVGKEWFQPSECLLDLIARKCLWTSSPAAATDYLYNTTLHENVRKAVRCDLGKRSVFCQLIGDRTDDDLTAYLYMRRIPSREYLARIERAYLAFTSMESKAA